MQLLSAPPWKNKLTDETWLRWFRDLYAQLKPNINRDGSFTPTLANISLSGDASVSASFTRIRGYLSINIQFLPGTGSITFSASATITNLPGEFVLQTFVPIYEVSGTTGTEAGICQVNTGTIEAPNLGAVTTNHTINLTGVVDSNEPISV